jgi:hypothetical protein
MSVQNIWKSELWEQAENGINLGHFDQLHRTSILSTRPTFVNHNIKEVIGIELNPNSMNMEVVFCLSRSWKSVVCSLTDQRKPSPHDNRARS